MHRLLNQALPLSLQANGDDTNFNVATPEQGIPDVLSTRASVLGNAGYDATVLPLPVSAVYLCPEPLEIGSSFGMIGHLTVVYKLQTLDLHLATTYYTLKGLSRGQLQNVGAILDRIKRIKGLKTDVELSRALGLTDQAVSVWRNRGTADFPKIIAFCRQDDLNWIMWGDESVTSEKDSNVSKDSKHPEDDRDMLSFLRTLGIDTPDKLRRFFDPEAIIADLVTVFYSRFRPPNGQ